MPAKRLKDLPAFTLYDPKACAAQAAELASYIHDAGLWTQSATRVAVAYYRLGDYTTPQGMFERILTFVRQIPNVNVRAGALFSVAEGLGDAEQGAFAEQILNEGLALLNYVDEAGRTSAALCAIATATAISAEGSQSFEDLQKAVGVSERIVDNALRVKAMSTIATSYVYVGRYDLGRDLLKEALNIAQRIEDDYARAIAYASLARAADMVGSRAWGFDMVKVSLQAAQAVLDPLRRCQLAAHLIPILYYMGEESLCEEFVTSGVQASLTINEPGSRAKAISALGKTMFKIGRIDRTENMLKDVASLYQRHAGTRVAGVCMASLVKALASVAEFPGEIRRRAQNCMVRSRRLTKEEQDQLAAPLRDASEHLAHGRFSVAMKILRNVSFQIQKYETKEKEARERANNDIFVLDADIQRLGEAGVDTGPLLESLASIRALFEKKRYGECISKCEELSARLRNLKKEVVPRVRLALPELRMQPHAWNKITVRLKNEGGMKATKTRVKFSGPIDIHGPTEGVEVQAGEEVTLELGAYPKETGNLPVRISLRYEDVDGELYSEDRDVWVDAQAVTSTAAPLHPEYEPASTGDETRRLAEVLLSISPDGETRPLMTEGRSASEVPHPTPGGVTRLTGLNSVEKTFEDWKVMTSTLPSRESMYEGVPIPPAGMFEASGDIIGDWNFFRLEPRVTETAGFFRGVHRFYAEREGRPLCVHLEISGTGEKARVILRTFSGEEDLPLLHGMIESELDKRFEISQFRK